MLARPHIVRAAVLAAGFVLSACTAIIVPDSEGTLDYCDVSGDCPEIQDNRHVSVCVLPEDLAPNADKICSSDYARVDCAGDFYGPGSTLTDAYLDALGDPTRYAACPAELLGQRGCAPDEAGDCAEGLAENVYGTCDDLDAPVLSVGAAQLELDEVVGRDVQDQFCRSYFCDERFVCSHRGDKPRCVVCDPERFFGRAGCGVLYLQGQPSPAYLDPADGNCNGDQPPTETTIGPQ